VVGVDASDLEARAELIHGCAGEEKEFAVVLRHNGAEGSVLCFAILERVTNQQVRGSRSPALIEQLRHSSCGLRSRASWAICDHRIVQGY
jgi:hypothetical protein